jgi:hypothetical protein
MPQSQPPSIFANNSTTNPHLLSQKGPASAPCTPLEEHPTQQPSWTPTLRLDLGASIPRPLVAPLHSNAGGSGGIALPKTPPAVAGKKRRPSATDDARPAHPQEPASEPLHKRRRLHAFARRSLDHSSFSRSAHFHANGQPPSPLFFSSRSPRPHLPARFSSSEAAARMLSKTQGEEGGIKTVTLARGTFNGLSPPAPSGTSTRSSERPSLPRTASPDARDRNDPLRLLGSVGVVELLEQDTRPTFVVDIGDAANHLPELSPLHILFANSALRSSASTWTLVAGKSMGQELDRSTTLASNQFRSWLLSTAIQAEGNPNANPSPVEHGGVIWSCYTLRKRLRVVSGAVPTHAAASITPASGPHEFPIPSTSSLDDISGNSILKSTSMEEDEPHDYFGTTGPAAIEQQPSTPKTGAQSRLQIEPVLSKDISGIFQKSADITIPAEDISFTNECVLRAHTAGDVDAFHREPHSTQDRDMGFFDWTRLPLTNSLPRHIQFARSIDWALTPLGPIELWSNDLRAMCNLIM